MSHPILQSEPFKKLVRNRWSFSLTMTAIILFLYFGFLLTIAFNKEAFGAKVGSVFTLGLVSGLSLIIISWLMTGVYVYWANNSYDNQVNGLIADFEKHEAAQKETVKTQHQSNGKAVHSNAAVKI